MIADQNRVAADPRDADVAATGDRYTRGTSQAIPAPEQPSPRRYGRGLRKHEEIPRCLHRARRGARSHASPGAQDDDARILVSVHLEHARDVGRIGAQRESQRLRRAPSRLHACHDGERVLPANELPPFARNATATGIVSQRAALCDVHRRVEGYVASQRVSRKRRSGGVASHSPHRHVGLLHLAVEVPCRLGDPAKRIAFL